MPTSAPTPIRRTDDVDRPLLNRLSPEWFRSNMLLAGWLAGEKDHAEAAIMLADGVAGGLQIELAGIAPEALDRWTEPLVGEAAAEARRCGARHLDAFVTSAASRWHATRLEALGFEIYETFDEYEVEIPWLVERIVTVREKIDRAISSRIDARVEEIQARHLDAVATAWSAWIGGPVDRGIQNLRNRFHQSAPDSASRRLQLVATLDGRVIGFASGHLKDDNVLKIEAEAVHPRHRLDPFFSELTLRLYRTALDLGASIARFEAGSRQPNTVNFVRRWKVTSIDSQKHLRLALDR